MTERTGSRLPPDQQEELDEAVRLSKGLSSRDPDDEDTTPDATDGGSEKTSTDENGN